MQLPPHRVQQLVHGLLSTVQPPRRRMSLWEWRRLLGELRSMEPGLPGSRGFLFSILQNALNRGNSHRLRLNQHVFDSIDDFKWMASSLGERPTRLRELVPVSPSDIGASDACCAGMGGIWFDTLAPNTAPIVWRQRFPTPVRAALITSDCPRGTLFISSDLEMTATIAHKDVLAQHRAVQERTLWIVSDNRAAVSWATKGSSTASFARAYLLRLNAYDQRTHRYVARLHDIPGPVNSMADGSSRVWHLTDADLLTHFNLHYPQLTSWTLRMLEPTMEPTMDSALIVALSRNAAFPGLSAAQPCR